MISQRQMLPLTGGAMIRTKHEVYGTILHRLKREYPRGYVETAHMLFILFGRQYVHEQKVFLTRKPSSFILPWDSPNLYAIIEHLVASLHVYFSAEPFDKAVFEKVYEEWKGDFNS